MNDGQTTPEKRSCFLIKNRIYFRIEKVNFGHPTQEQWALRPFPLGVLVLFKVAPGYERVHCRVALPAHRSACRGGSFGGVQYVGHFEIGRSSLRLVGSIP